MHKQEYPTLYFTKYEKTLFWFKSYRSAVIFCNKRNTQRLQIRFFWDRKESYLDERGGCTTLVNQEDSWIKPLQVIYVKVDE